MAQGSDGDDFSGEDGIGLRKSFGRRSGWRARAGVGGSRERQRGQQTRGGCQRHGPADEIAALQWQ